MITSLVIAGLYIVSACSSVFITVLCLRQAWPSKKDPDDELKLAGSKVVLPVVSTILTGWLITLIGLGLIMDFANAYISSELGSTKLLDHFFTVILISQVATIICIFRQPELLQRFRWPRRRSETEHL